MTTLNSIGAELSPQPTQIFFENALTYDLISLTQDGEFTLVMEDEGRNIRKALSPRTST